LFILFSTKEDVTYSYWFEIIFTKEPNLTTLFL
jgi:hypothetical protein